MDTLFITKCMFIGEEQCEACGTSRANESHFAQEIHFVKDEDPLTDNLDNLDHLEYMAEKIPDYIQMLINKAKKKIERIPTTKYENPNLPNTCFFCSYCASVILEYLQSREEFMCITMPKNKRIECHSITKYVFEPLRAPVKSARKT